MLVTSSPDRPLTVTVWDEGRPRLRRRAQKVAPVLRRKLISLPSAVMVTRGFWVEMTVHVRARWEDLKAYQTCCWTI